MQQINLIKAIVSIGLFFFCTNCQAQIAVAKNEIEKNNTIYFDLYAKNDGSILSLYTDDACLLAPNALPICGMKALKSDFENTFAAGIVKSGRFVTENLYGDAKEYVTEEGTWQVFDAKGQLLDEGKYLKLWKKTKAGWKIHRDSFNSNRKVHL